MESPTKFYTNIPRFETNRLILRKLTIEDAFDLFEYASEPKVSQYVPWEVHKTIQDSHAFLEYVVNAYERKKSFRGELN